MVEQGCSRFSVDESGRILDRLAGLEKIILPGLVRRALAATGKQSTRRCSLTNEIMIWVVLAMGLFTEMPIRQVFKVSRRLRKGRGVPRSFESVRGPSASGKRTTCGASSIGGQADGNRADDRGLLPWHA